MHELCIVGSWIVGSCVVNSKTPLDSGNSLWMKFFSDKSILRVTLDESLILVFVSACKIMLVGGRLFNTTLANLSCHL